MGNKVFIDVVARTARLEKGLAKSNKDLKRFSRQAKSTANVLKSALGGAFAALSARAIFQYTSSILKAVDSTAKFADLIGISTEALTGLEFAARKSGVQTNAFRMGLQRMTRRIAEAAQGTGEAKDAIRELGLDAKALAKAGPEAAFSQIADAMQRVDDASARVRLGFKLFDSEGVALVNTLKGGSAQLDVWAAQADALGVSFSRVDAARVEAANDAMLDLAAAGKALSIAFAISVAPTLAKSASAMVELIEDITIAIRELRRLAGLGDGIARSVANIRTRASILTPRERPQELREFRDGRAVAFGEDTGLQQLQGGEAVKFAELSEETLVIFREAAAERTKIQTKLADEVLRQDKRMRQSAIHEAEIRQEAVQNVASALVSLTSIGASESKKMFNINKAASIAEVAIATAAGIARGFRELPPPAAWANALAVGAMGAAQISAINSTSFGGGGGVAPGVAAVGDAGGTSSQAGPRVIEVLFSGRGEPTRQNIIEIMDGIGQAVGDGVELKATGLV